MIRRHAWYSGVPDRACALGLPLRHPQLFVFPDRRAFARTRDLFPQSHRHRQTEKSPAKPTNFSATSLPNRCPVRSMNRELLGLRRLVIFTRYSSRFSFLAPAARSGAAFR